ncbi:alpha/beta hydrolase [Myxococcota bacterium]|nr:alpha/beta hydrolase [Myxococcota bacterium]
MKFALRIGATPLALTLRWANNGAVTDWEKIPLSRWNPGLWSKVALDEAFFASELAATPLVAGASLERIASEVQEALTLFKSRGWLDDPASFHKTPPPPRQIWVEPSRSGLMKFDHLRFESGYAPHRGEPGRERWLGYDNNRTAHVWALEHPGPARPWVVCVPGYRMGWPLIDFTGFRTRWLHRELGLNVAIPVMPLHGPRRIGMRGGDGLLSGDIMDALHAQAQSTWDVRRVLAWLRGRDVPGVGLYGVSLGASIAAVVAALEPKLDCVVAGIPLCDLSGLIRSHAPRLLLRAASHWNLPINDVESLYSVVSPLHLEPGLIRERRFLFAGLADHLSTPDQAFDLWRHWGRPPAAWYHGSHVSFVWENEVQSLLSQAFENVGLLTRTPREAAA